MRSAATPLAAASVHHFSAAFLPFDDLLPMLHAPWPIVLAILACYWHQLAAHSIVVVVAWHSESRESLDWLCVVVAVVLVLASFAAPPLEFAFPVELAMVLAGEMAKCLPTRTRCRYSVIWARLRQHCSLPVVVVSVFLRWQRHSNAIAIPALVVELAQRIVEKFVFVVAVAQQLQ